MAYYPSRIATHDGEGSNISRYHCACANDCASSDPTTLKHERSLAHPGSILHHGKVDRSGAVGPYRLTEIVGSAVLLKKHAVRAYDDPIPESGPINSASWADA